MNCTGERCLMQFGKVDPKTCKCVSYCPQATPPKTNADYIRAMSDEELADKFEEIQLKTVKAYGNDDLLLKGELKKYWLDWLKKEAEETEK